MKSLTTSDPAKATELLQQAPQLSYAIFQALLLMGLVSTDALSSVVEAAAAQPAPPQQGYGAPPTGYYPPGFPPPPLHMSGQMGIPMGTPPVQGHGSYPPPPMQHRAPPAQQPAPQAVPDSDALMQQVLAMPQELIDSLPPADRAQLMALRASYGR
jgi:cleavage stimulation factor subunit 2